MSRLILLLLWPMMAAATTGEWIAVSTAPKNAELTVLRWRYAVSGTGAAASFEAALPRPRHGGWALVRLQATEAARLQKDAAGNLTLAVDALALGAGETRIVTVTAELAAVTPVAGTAAAIEGASSLLDLESVRPLAAQVISAAPARRLDVLWETLTQRLEPEGFLASPRRVKTTLSLGRGDCTDLALVVVSVARASGLPARLATGWNVDGSGLLGPDAYHDWAEVHDGTRWRVLDLHSRRFDPEPGTRVATHIDDVRSDVLTAFRFRPLTAGLEVQMLDGGGTARGGLR